ncbi:unnamed protein product [Rotaria sordida]|uniref:Protein fem-1 homolog B n=1 Tax=Rotaria sordida TaxID=392033 RepID=A0A819Q019_9BILA|nr:unnamed protein product [Rotaria sordida]CAF4017024.1 unnamed protein product [Rotaria sordida]
MNSMLIEDHYGNIIIDTVESYEIEIKCKADVNHGPLHPLLIDATIRGRLDIVEFLVENDYVDINQTKTNDENKSSSLIVAANHGHTQIVNYLIEKNAELESKTYIDENTALAVAAIKGHLESVRLLYKSGASSNVENHEKKTRIVLAAENNQLDVVNFLLEHNHDRTTLDDLDLAVASHILSHKTTEDYKPEWIIQILQHSFIKRTQLNITKIVAEPITVYDFQQECQSIDELDRIQHNKDRLYIEALLIQERILLPRKDERLFTPLFERATAFIEKGEFDSCLDLTLHIFHLCQQFEVHNCRQQFFWIFYTMFNSKMPIPVDRFWDICDLIFKPSQQNSIDCHKRDARYLLATAGKMDHSEIPLILRELNLNEDCVANIYNHGSYAQGTCTPESDRDLIIVTRSCQNYLWLQNDFAYFHSFELHKLFNKYDVCVYSVENFQLALEKNYLLCVQCLFLSDEFKIKEEIDFRTTYLEKYYNTVRIKQVAFYEMLSSFNLLDPPKNPTYPKRSSTENETNQPLSDFIFKNLFHGIRFLDIGEQLIQTRSVHDFTRVSYILNEMKDIRGDPTDESSKHRVVEYVHKKSIEFKSKLDVLVPTNIIEGTFKVHITFDCKPNSEQVIEKLKKTCEKTKYKIAFIQLRADKKKNNLQQLIAFSYYHDEYPSIVQAIEKEIHEQFKDFNILRIQKKSLASNEGIPQTDIDKELFWNEKTYYFEFHYRIVLKHELDEKFLKFLQKRCESNSRYKLYLSPYALKQIDHKKFHYIITMRLFDVGRNGAFQMNDQVIKYYKGILFLPSKIEPEFIVYDTNMDLMNLENS